MKNFLFLVAIILSGNLFGGGDPALLKNDSVVLVAQDGLMRDEAHCVKVLAICRAKEGRARELPVWQAGEMIDTFEAQFFAEKRFRETEEEERIAREYAENSQVQAIIEQAAEDEHRARKCLVPEFVEEDLRCPHSIVRQGLFTEKGAMPIQNRLIDLIEQERKGIYGAMYIFANKYVAQAIIGQVAHKKIKVTILVDASFEEHRSKSCLRSLVDNGVQVLVAPTGLGKEKKIMHHKFLLFEDNESGPFFENNESGPLLWNGSYNISYQANKNDENVEITNDPAPIGQFRQKLGELILTSEPILFSLLGRGPEVTLFESNPAT